jgi:hypothetical protein
MPRTVIQITADPSYLYALCDDGEIFSARQACLASYGAIRSAQAGPKSEIDPFKDEQPVG